MLECADESTARAIGEHKQTKQLCERIGAKGLVVPTKYEDQFRKAINIIGYGMPR